MSKSKVVGKGVYSGEYQGVKYTKILLILESPAPNKFSFFDGQYTETVVCPLNEENDLVQVGDFVRVYYNKYGKVDTVIVCNDNE